MADESSGGAQGRVEVEAFETAGSGESFGTEEVAAGLEDPLDEGFGSKDRAVGEIAHAQPHIDMAWQAAPRVAHRVDLRGRKPETEDAALGVMGFQTATKELLAIPAKAVENRRAALGTHQGARRSA